MNNKSIWHFLKPGLQTTLQDNGRLGYQHLGVPVGGVLDAVSANLANKLLDNEPGNPVLEITLVGPKVEIQGACQIAITGANLSPQINERFVPMYTTIEVNDGDVLSFGKVENGCRSYIGIRGNLQIRKWLGSCSAVAFNDYELTPDSIFRKGSKLIIEDTSSNVFRKISNNNRPKFSNQITAKVLPGPEFAYFSKIQIAWFFSQTFTITPSSNRMGYLLDKSLHNFKPALEVISSAVIPGTIQITNSGLPVVLMADAQTTGGYHRIANIITKDLARLAQLKTR